jgi:type IX secretion system PorP/SprF family membrane protein
MLLIILCISETVKSQSDFDLSQRWFNESIYNPGATGNHFSTGIFFHSRLQWIGISGAPITNVLSFDTYMKSFQSGFGLSVYTDKIGYLNSWSAKLSYAYYIFFSEESTLALGLSGYLQNRNSNVFPEMFDQTDDPVLGYSKINESNPNFDFGIEFKGPVRIGASVRHLLKLEPVNTVFPAHSMNFWTYASSRLNVSQGLGLEPAVSYMYRDNISRIEGGLIMYFFKTERKIEYDKCWAGIMYRMNKQFAILAGVNILDKLRLGYSFDYGAGDLATISKMGTHEIFLSWLFTKKTSRDCYAYKKHNRK